MLASGDWQSMVVHTSFWNNISLERIHKNHHKSQQIIFIINLKRQSATGWVYFVEHTFSSTARCVLTTVKVCVRNVTLINMIYLYYIEYSFVFDCSSAISTSRHVALRSRQIQEEKTSTKCEADLLRLLYNMCKNCSFLFVRSIYFIDINEEFWIFVMNGRISNVHFLWH